MRRLLLVLLFLILALPSAQGQYLYKAMMVRAAPGHLLDVIEMYQGRMAVYDASGDERPFMMRHSQGDHWDVMFLYPMESFTAYYAPERVDARNRAAEDAALPQATFRDQFYQWVAWHEEIFVEGPPLEAVRAAFEGAGYFHVEMFLALPGKWDALYEEREMENVYLKTLGRPENLIFTHDQGAAWDMFTIGFYRDLKHFAESADIPAEREDAAARAAGFEAADRIGTYLRSLIQSHHDTLAIPIR